MWDDNDSLQVYNLGTVFMMAYAFLVIPKESIQSKRIDVSLENIEAVLNKMDITVNENKKSIEHYQNIIRHIRNSIAHANFEIIPIEDKIIFIDIHNKIETFKGSIQTNDFISFLSNYFKAYYKSYHEKFIANTNN